MKKIILITAMIAALALGGISVSAAGAARQNRFCAGDAVRTGAVECPRTDCPNNGTPAQDGTGYQGGREDDEAVECPRTDCPNDGTPAQDGTGYQGGREDGEAVECPRTDCPNDGVPARDGTGHRGGGNHCRRGR